MVGGGKGGRGRVPRSIGTANLFDHEEQDLVEDSAACDLHRRVQVLLLVPKVAGNPVCLHKLPDQRPDMHLKGQNICAQNCIVHANRAAHLQQICS